MTSLPALRAEALELIASGHQKIAEGNVILARLERSTPAPAANGRGLPDLISLEAALELIPTPMRRETLMRQVGAKLDFGARFRVETDENAILAQFIEEEFEAWRTKKLDRTEGGE